MDLPVGPPVAPMLAKLSRDLPRGGFLYEPKWDGFRCIAFVSAEDVDLRSRHDRPLARYFPEIVDGLRDLGSARSFVADGEIVGADEPNFEALMLRLHPAASRVEKLARETPAAYVAFDLLALGDDDLRERPFAERRQLLAALLADAPPSVRLTPATDDAAVAEDWLTRFTGNGIDGVIAKPLDSLYLPGKRALTKVKHERTADCVVAGFRTFANGPVASLLLGLFGDDRQLVHVGVASSFTAKRRVELAAELRQHVAPLTGHPWEHGYLLGGGAGGRLAGAAGRWSPDEMELDWNPIAPLLVCEVAYDQVDGYRFRHPARFRRWRPDREPESCTLDQLDVDAPAPGDVLALR